MTFALRNAVCNLFVWNVLQGASFFGPRTASLSGKGTARNIQASERYPLQEFWVVLVLVVILYLLLVVLIVPVLLVLVVPLVLLLVAAET